ncbi:DUF1345 domain-containing protein [Leucobacter rhizosphaerae]|uniref:DUF1345 domain-containing protein n=1 Tax=Leucobacter rhizosphaerae TaxID=2932245 RepID=A0ABY4FU07_9MICO|nr:DUF1345 domain-containing protein [Leucobacter rhizosphaerae]UOQ59753.1 DUF1345 domain-containing protein [Leucobacter rhizosphaerae]
MTTQSSVRSRLGIVLSTGSEIIGLIAQLVLVYVGGSLLLGDDDPDDVYRLLFWCIIASLYLGATILSLNILVRLDQPDPAATRVLVGHPLTRALSTIVSFGASLVGLSVALDLITSLGLEQHDTIQEASAIWAMMLSWAMFNWGFARIYFSRYHKAGTPPLLFPGTPEPRLVDFVYLSFTNATTFSVSDVQVVDSRMRWTIVWHTTLAFFFNALIIVLTMNVIANGRLFADLFS